MTAVRHGGGALGAVGSVDGAAGLGLAWKMAISVGFPYRKMAPYNVDDDVDAQDIARIDGGFNQWGIRWRFNDG